MSNSEKDPPRNSLLAGIIKHTDGIKWFFRERIVKAKRGKGRKNRARNSNRTKKEQGE
jgi:hypothetical protein